MNAIQEYEELGSIKAVPFVPKRYFKEYVGHIDGIKNVNGNKFYGPTFNKTIAEWASSGRYVIFSLCCMYVYEFNTLFYSWVSSNKYVQSGGIIIYLTFFLIFSFGGSSLVNDPYEGEFRPIALGLMDDTFFPNPPPTFCMF